MFNFSLPPAKPVLFATVRNKVCDQTKKDISFTLAKIKGGTCGQILLSNVPCILRIRLWKYASNYQDVLSFEDSSETLEGFKKKYL